MWKSTASWVLVFSLAACGGNDSEPATPPSAVTASIGTQGGTLNGPDGVQVIVPAGALSQATTLGIARSAAGAPALPTDNPPAGSVYEFTPHDLVFKLPVTIRMPVPANAVGKEIFMASPGEGWQVNSATVVNGVAEWQRNSFSWGLMGLDCALPANNTDPYPCVWPRGHATASAVPAAALTQQSPGTWQNSAGSWLVNQAGTVTLTLNYEVAPDCGSNGSGTVRLIRWNPAATPRVVQTLLADVPVTLTSTAVTLPPGAFASTGGGPSFRGKGSTSFDVSAYLGDATNAFGFSFSCARPGRPAHGGGDLITILGPMPAPVGPHSIGGTVNGLTGTGLVLQNNGGDNLSVAANATAFSFATPVANAAAYSVSVLTQPGGQTCTVQNGSGTASGAITNVAISCITPAGLALVANSGANTLSIYRADASSGVLSALGTTGTGAYPYAIAITPNGLFAYVTNLAGNNVSSYSVNAASGSVTPVGSSVNSVNPYGIAMDPLGRFTWVANYSAHTVSAYSIDGATGQLTAVGAPAASGLFPYAVAAHPSGNFVYVANEVGNSVSAYSVNAGTGALTLLAGTIANSVASPHSIVVDPSGRFVYVTNSGSLAAFRVNASTGVLSVVGYSSTGTTPTAVAVHPNGLFVYATTSNGVSAFAVNSTTGALTAIGSAVAAGSIPTGLAVDAAGTHLYVTDAGGRSTLGFSIDVATGALASLGAGVATGNGPGGIVITP